MTVEWFRNTTWDQAVEETFEAKLRRARRKGQYLRIQACTLTSAHPEVALRLLDRYFRLSDDFDHAQAHVDRARALLTLGRADEAIASYEAALAREQAFPRLLTEAYLDLPFLIATAGKRELYGRALALLQAHEGRLMFPVDHFRWHATRAMIAGDQHDHGEAKRRALTALEAAATEHSGLRYHPAVGLVGHGFESVVRKLEAYIAA